MGARTATLEHPAVLAAVALHQGELGCAPLPEDRTAFLLAAERAAAGRSFRVAGIPAVASDRIVELLGEAAGELGDPGLLVEVAAGHWDATSG